MFVVLCFGFNASSADDIFGRSKVWVFNCTAIHVTR
jgi:hypothetical protein